MQLIKTLIDRLAIQPALGSQTFAMVPLVRAVPSTLGYQRLAEALAAGTLRITEIGEHGSVPNLKVTNTGALPVLMLDGCALVGAKQNRILNLTILVPPKSELTVPVSCVEQGRWRRDSAEFSEGSTLHFAAARARKLEDVSASMLRGDAPRADQRGVWDEVERYGSEFRAHAPTGAMQDVYGAVAGGIDDLVKSLAPLAGQVGAVFLGGASVLGMDLFDSHATFAGEFDKVVRSYAVDALARAEGAAAAPEAAAAALVRQHLEGLAASEWRAYAGVGLGEDLRSTDGAISAGALAYAGEIVHLVAFTRRARPQRAPADMPPPMPPRFGCH